MQTAVLNENKTASKPYSLLDGIRNGTTNLQRANLAEMVEAVGCTTFQLNHHAGSGNDYIQLLNEATKDYFSIKIGAKVDRKGKTGTELIKHCLLNYVIFTGQSENGLWFSFAPEGTPTAPLATISIDELKKSVKALAGG